MNRIAPGVPIVTAHAMRAAEQRVFDIGVQQRELMERAGAAVAREAMRFAFGRPILVLAGPGNNGGDAYAAARLLKAAGQDVVVATLGRPGHGAAVEMAAQWDGETVALAEAGPRPVLIDGLFGVGLSRPLDREVSAHLERLCSAAAFVLAIDVPSGVATDSGELLGAAFAHRTLSFAALKPAHVCGAAAARCGSVAVADIGVPVESDWRSAMRTRLRAPAFDAHKYSRGLVVVVEGAMPGAARLAACAAAAGGAGYVVLAGSGQGDSGPDAIVRRRAQNGSELAELLADKRITAVVIGPGLGRNDHAVELLDAALASEQPLVIDGDAISLLGEKGVARLAGRSAITCLTPHGGEFERMFGTGTGSKIEATLAAARASDAVVLHKGASSVLADAAGKVRVMADASSWLSTAGTGDVLAGLFGARLAGADPLDAGEQAMWLHARAATLAGPGFVADSLIDHIGEAMGECL